MVNILYFHNSSLISGGERSLLALWKSIDRVRFNPIALLPGEGPLAEEARKLRIKVYVFCVPRIYPWVTWGLIKAVRKLSGIVVEEKISLIHSYSPRNNAIAWWVGKRKHIAVIWHERNLIYGRERDVTRDLLKWPQAVICNSQAVAARFLIQGRLPDKVRVILNGVDCLEFTPADDKESAKASFGWQGKIIVGLVSHLGERKGVETFLEIAELVSRARKDVFFVVVGGEYNGSPDRLSALKRYAQSLGLSDKVFWSGFQIDVGTYLKAFDVACNVTEKEACSRSILEAMAAGVPVAAFADGGTPELVVDGETGILVTPGDKKMFASRLAELLEHHDVRLRLGAGGRARAQNLFDVKINAEKTMALYDELLEKKGQVR
ncbi:MAG: glycosyltransferase family 4 protein [Candidatus Omnitrophica bacterium]|nr:glycosyltransferase family 4 protein [Candidatus Omnitrophota bacterium]